MTLFADEPDAGTEPKVTCQRPGCNRPLTDPESIALGIGPECARQLGLVPASRVAHVGRVRGWRDCDGQGDLLAGEET